MSEQCVGYEPVAPSASDAGAGRWVVAGFLVLLCGGTGAFLLLRKPPPPPPAEIAGDPLLLAGRAVYLDRCVSCHGPRGKGDGPIARGLSGTPVGDLTRAKWKHGDRPEQVRAVIAEGVPRASMPGWGQTLSPENLDAVTAWMYYLAGREVPSALRESGPRTGRSQ